MIIWCNQDIESHRTWLENFGTTAEDTVKDNKLDTYVSAKTYPTVEVTIPAKSFEETVAEWINPVTGEQQGEQTVSINVDEHIGIYYFANRQAVLDCIANTLDNMPGPVAEPTGTTEVVPDSFLPDIPEIYTTV